MIAPSANILIVDDMPDKHVVFRSILEDLGENIVSARSGREALAQVLDHEFAVLLLDVNMPDIDALETASLIRHHKRSARTPIVFITAYVDELPARKSYALGAVDSIPSPVVPEVLRSKVRVFVELHRMNRQLQLRAAEREALAREQAARAAAEQAVARADYLAQASQELSRSLDLQQTREALLRVAVPHLAEQAALVEAADGEDPAATADGSDGVVVLPLGTADQPFGALVLRGPAASFDAARLALAREVASRATIAMENARLYAAVRAADRRKNEFLAMLAHELRNPLAPIRNAVHIMQGPEVDPHTLAWGRDVISRQAEHMARLIDDLLDVSRIVQGKVVVKPERLALAAVVERTVEACGPRLDARAQALQVDLPPQPVWLHGDAVRLAQVLANLVHNASKFSPPQATLHLSAAYEGGEVVIQVRDPGCGIEPGFLPHIFELFVQGEQALDRSQGGLGIGLTLVRHLVELHDGRVEAFSEGAGQGTQVVVRLPAFLEPDPEPALAGGTGPARLPVDAMPARLAAARGERVEGSEVCEGCDPDDAGRRVRRVLVVDDLAASADTLTLLLEMEGFEVRVAGEGRAALAIAREFRPDAVLLDIGLPGMSGFEVAGHLREEPATREALLVALTGYGEAESRSRSAQAGFDVHLVKPADVEALLSLLADPQAARQKVQRAAET